MEPPKINGGFLMAKEKTIEFTKYERARMIGSRALQLSMGAPFLVKFTDEELRAIKYNPIEIAMRELSEGVIPITVRRPTA